MAVPTVTQCIILVLCLASVTNMAVVKGQGSTPINPPKRCTEGLGPCSERCDINCCTKLCNNYYSGSHPVASCEDVPGTAIRLCICRHDCSA